MKDKTVKNVMTSLDEYGTISVTATLYEAAMTLWEVHQDIVARPPGHAVLLICNEQGDVVGKLSQLDVLRALEPKSKHLEDTRSLSRFGVSPGYLKPMFNQCGFWDQPLIDICREAGTLKVERLVHRPVEGEYVDENASLVEAIHQLATEHHQFLLVTRKGKVVGILRQEDMFREVVETLQVCQL